MGNALQQPFFHVGLIVQNLEAAQKELSDTLGIHWSKVDSRSTGPYPVRVAWSIEGPPYVELLEGRAEHGSPWDTTPGNRLDYLGFWVGDIDAAKRAAVDDGLPIDFDAPAHDAGTFTFHRLPHTGIRVELVQDDVRDKLLAAFFPPPVGAAVQPFTVIRGAGEKLASAELLRGGPVLLAFMPFAFADDAHLGELAARAAELEAAGVRVAALAHDSPFALAAWAERVGVELPLLSDWNWEAATALGAGSGGERGTFYPAIKRSAFLIDDAGVLRHAWRAEGDEPLPFEAFLGALQPA